MLGVERGGQRGQPGPWTAVAVERRDLGRHGDLESLPVVAQVHVVGGGLLGAGHALRLDGGRGGLGQLVQQAEQLVVADRAERPDVGAGRLVPDHGGGVAVGAQHARRRRDDHRPRAGQPAERVGVQRARAAEGDQREVAGVEALLHGHQAQRAEHVLVDDVHDAGRGRLHAAQLHRVRDGLDRGLGGLRVEGDLAAGQLGGQVAEHHVGVGHRRLGAAHPVRGRAGHRPGRLRADPQRPGQRRDVRDGPAARAHRPDVHRGGPHLEVADHGLPPDPRQQVLHQRDVGGGAAHVEREEVAVARPARRPRPRRPRRRPGRTAASRPGCRPRSRRWPGRRRCAGCTGRPIRRRRPACPPGWRCSGRPAGGRSCSRRR